MPLNAARQSLPKQPIEDPIEQKAEELRKRALSYTAPQEPVQTNYTRKLQEAEEEYTQWTYQKKTKKSLVNKKWLAISCTGVVLLFAAWWAGSNVFKTTAPATSTTLHQTEKQEQDPVSAEEINTPIKNRSLQKRFLFRHMFIPLQLLQQIKNQRKNKPLKNKLHCRNKQ
jgi:hypothetical protein